MGTGTGTVRQCLVECEVGSLSSLPGIPTLGTGPTKMSMMVHTKIEAWNDPKTVLEKVPSGDHTGLVGERRLVANEVVGYPPKDERVPELPLYLSCSSQGLEVFLKIVPVRLDDK